MTTDWKALCAELVAIEDVLSGGGVQFSNQGQALDGYSALAAFRDVAARACAALAQPEPEGPTDDRIMDVAREADLVYYMGQGLGFASPYMEGADITEEVLAFARAVLAHYGNHLGSPDSSPPLAAELIAAVEAIQADPDDCKDYENDYRNGWIDACSHVLELLHRRRTGALSPCSELDQ